MTDTTPPAAWERQANEPNLWFRRFQAFLRLGHRRSMLAVYRAERESDGKRAPHTVPEPWAVAAKEWQWGARAEAWDEYQAQQEMEKWQQRYRDLREEEWRIHSELVEKAKQMLVFPLARTTRQEKDAGGHVITETVIIPTKWSMADAAKFVELASKLGRLASENATDTVTMDISAASLARQVGLDDATFKALYDEIYRKVKADFGATAGPDAEDDVGSVGTGASGAPIGSAPPA